MENKNKIIVPEWFDTWVEFLKQRYKINYKSLALKNINQVGWGHNFEWDNVGTIKE